MSKHIKTKLSFRFECALEGCNKTYIANSSLHNFCTVKCQNKQWSIDNGRTCPGCGYVKSRSARANTLCKSCKTNELKKISKGEYLAQVSGRSGQQNMHSALRGLGRTWNKQILLEPCAHCGYNKHVQLAHKRPVSDFPDTALLEEINSPDNVIALCPNCHWEFDHPKE